MRPIRFSIKQLCFTSLFLLAITFYTKAQEKQEAFSKKMSDVYLNAADQKKALEIAKSLHKMVEQNKELQTYVNYFILKQIFENQAPDTALAKSCKEKSDKLLAEMTGVNANGTMPGNDSTSQWLNKYYTTLFTTTDPDNASKALKFLSQNPSIQNFNNYNYVAYAFERNGDFQSAKENYEHAISLIKDDINEFVSYSFYTNFLARSGEYLKAEEYLEKMDKLSTLASDFFKSSYKMEALTSKALYYLNIGDYFSYLQASNDQYEQFTKKQSLINGCDPYSMGRFTFTAYAKEMLGDFSHAEELWYKRDSSNYAWVNCHNKQYPTNKQYSLSILPVYQMKTGKKAYLKQPLAYYVKETEEHYNSFDQYSDFSIRFMKASHLGYLGAAQYHEEFKNVMQHVITTKDFRQSTMPFSSYAYFTMRDRRYQASKDTYEQLFKINVDWINDVIFSFGEKAFVTYYNNKLKEGYENFHSFVRIAKEKKLESFPVLSSQAYNNILFTKSLSLKGTQKRKQAFLKANDPTVIKLYEDWILKKQELIRQYRRSEDAQSDSKNVLDVTEMKKLQDEVNHLENELALKAKDFKKYLKLAPPDWKSVRNQLKEGEAAIEMIRFQWRDQLYYSDSAFYAAYIITKNSTYPEVVYLPNLAAELDSKFYKYYQNSIKFKTKDEETYKRFWKPIKDQLKGIKKIYFSPDGIYHLINMSTLQNPETGMYLLDELDIHYITSSVDVQNTFLGTDIKTAVLIGRPTYQIEGIVKNQVAPADDDTRSLVRGFRSTTSVSDLPGTEEEVKTIKKEMDQYFMKVNLYIKEEATEDLLYQLHSPDILHIATHGYWSEIGHASTDGYRTFNAMVNSGLLMSGVINYYSSKEYPDTYDGIITAYEAQNLDLDHTSLVILSACETSLGHFDAGEGVYGLQRAFRSAGAKSIMTSLWKVDDAATKDFMILFYQNFLKTKDKFEAFRTAQKALKEKYPDPYFWGAFVLTGI